MPMMGGDQGRERAVRPEDLGRFFVERANAGDVDGLVALYEPDAVLALPDGEVARGGEEIRRIYEQLLADRPQFPAGELRPALRNGDFALTSTRLVGGGATVEVARRQPDGSWLWLLDQPNVLG
jgi:ketosteroid isomerase-like protein